MIFERAAISDVPTAPHELPLFPYPVISSTAVKDREWVLITALQEPWRVTHRQVRHMLNYNFWKYESHWNTFWTDPVHSVAGTASETSWARNYNSRDKEKGCIQNSSAEVMSLAHGSCELPVTQRPSPLGWSIDSPFPNTSAVDPGSHTVVQNNLHPLFDSCDKESQDLHLCASVIIL